MKKRRECLRKGTLRKNTGCNDEGETSSCESTYEDLLNSFLLESL